MVLNLKIKSSTSFYDVHIIKPHHSKSVARETPHSKTVSLNSHRGCFPGKRSWRPGWKPAPECAFGGEGSPPSHLSAAEDKTRDNFESPARGQWKQRIRHSFIVIPFIKKIAKGQVHLRGGLICSACHRKKIFFPFSLSIDSEMVIVAINCPFV